MMRFKILLGLGVAAVSFMSFALIQSDRKRKKVMKYIEEAHKSSYVQDILKGIEEQGLSYSKKEDINVHYRCTLETFKSPLGFTINRLTSYGPMSEVCDFYVEYQGQQVEIYADYLYSHAVYTENKNNKS